MKLTYQEYKNLYAKTSKKRQKTSKIEERNNIVCTEGGGSDRENRFQFFTKSGGGEKEANKRERGHTPRNPR